MTDTSTLPACSVQYPMCGACGYDTGHDGDTYYCPRCDLDYDAGADATTATYRDPNAQPCRKPDTFHGGNPCQLPETHRGERHWAPW